MRDTEITLRGNLGSDVTLTATGGGPLATFRLGSTSRRLREGRWEDAGTLWVSVKAWQALATHAAASLAHGDPVVVHGRLTAESWQREDGTRATRQVVVASTVGHDLARGTSVFTKAAPPTGERPGGTAAATGTDTAAPPVVPPAGDAAA